MIPKPVRALGTGAALILGGILTLNLVSSATVGALRLAAEAKRVKNLKTITFRQILILFGYLDNIIDSFSGFCSEKYSGTLSLPGL